MNVSEIARPTIKSLFPICRREVFEQLDLVTAGCFHDREFQFGAFYSRDLLRPFPRLMRAVRKFETEYISPKLQRAFEIRNRDAGVVCCDDLEVPTHVRARF